MSQKMNKLEKVLGYSFSDKVLLMNALSHSSYTAEKGLSYPCNNERLEFIGDAFLDAVIGLRLYDELPDGREGTLSKKRSVVVCESSLAEAARKIGLGDYLYLGNGEELTGGRDKDSILADAFEAVIGAVVLDGGYGPAADVVNDLLGDTVRLALENRIFNDYKTELQERVQTGHDSSEIKYVLIKEEGPDHNKLFTVSVMISGTAMGTGQGRTKKEAEQNAAKDVITKGEF